MMVLKQENLYCRVRTFWTLPHQEGEYLGGASDSRDAREEKTRDPRKSCSSAGKEKTRTGGFVVGPRWKEKTRGPI